MNTGKKIFATIQVINGEIVVDIGNTSKYMAIKFSDGVICIVERKSQEFIEIKNKG